MTSGSDGPSRHVAERDVVTAYLGLGSNVGDRLEILASAVFALDESDGIAVTGVSGVYETAPWGGVEQPAFLNLVVEIATTLSAHELLDECQLTESVYGRDRDAEQRWGPRTLDIDILLYGDEYVDTPGLVVPHPRLTERVFVLVPLLDVMPGGALPDGTRIARLLNAHAPLEGIELYVRLTEVPGAGRPRPVGPRSPAAVLAEDWQGEQPEGGPPPSRSRR